MQPFEFTITGVATLQQQDEAAERDERFTALVHRQSGFVYRVAYALLKNAHDSEDVVQETFMKLFRSRAWQSMSDERAFLARTAWRLAIDKLPKRRTESIADLDLLSPAQSPEQAVILTDSHAALHRMIDALPEDLRQPLALSAIQELNSRQVAAILGISEGTVRTRQMRARQLLREKFQAMKGGAR